MRSFVLLAVTTLLIGGAGSAAGQQPLQNLRTSEAEVRSMPLEDRPNRLGHFYGNNVRRLQQRTICVNCGKGNRPLRRYLYMTR